MKILIDIPQELYDRAINGELTDIDSMYICGLVANSKPIEDNKADIGGLK